jgi:hypothetical protein
MPEPIDIDGLLFENLSQPSIKIGIDFALCTIRLPALGEGLKLIQQLAASIDYFEEAKVRSQQCNAEFLLPTSAASLLPLRDSPREQVD